VDSLAVPKKKTSRAKRGSRRSHDALKVTQATEECPNCHEIKLMHRVCPHCGYYRGKKILVIEEEK
jgi:large subunit ribosomal protein L32